MEMRKYSTSSGKSAPLGVSYDPNGINFALFAPDASDIYLGLFPPGGKIPEVKLPLQRSGDVWHIKVREELPKNIFYGYLVDNHWILDPFAKELNATPIWGNQVHPLLGKVFPDTEFDWEGDKPLNLPFEDLMIYEMHVRGFTENSSSKVKHPGTFLGLVEKIPYLKKIGINAVELLPIFAFDEALSHFTNPETGEKLYNYWGYSTLNFFSPMAPYGSIRDFKKMVKALHNAGIEVILDVVYNHVGTHSFSLLANEVYFILDQEGNHTNYTGCGNTVNCNNPIVIDFIVSSLRYWVEEMHVDGFRFDLASIFCRDAKGDVLKNPPIIRAITKSHALSHTKLIAETWDAAGLYQVGSFPGKRFAEWNGRFRDVVRIFLKGTDNFASDFATVMLGSPDLYEDKKSPYQSINFVTSHDGFTLYDLVSYNEKHNEANGEENRDGDNCNNSWNCGAEGETDDPAILALRERQMRNFLLALTVAIGTPMYHMGDEYGHTREGNNNGYCQDNALNYFLWNVMKENSHRIHFFQDLLSFRKNCPLFQRKRFFTENNLNWHGLKPNDPNWDSRFVAYTLEEKNIHLYIAFNAYFEGADIELPSPPRFWTRIVDTFLEKQNKTRIENQYYLQPYSSLLLISS